MFNIKLSPQLITIWMVGLILTPRFFSSYSAEIGTLCILLFWVAMLVMNSDFISGYESREFYFRSFPLITRIAIIILVTICVITFVFKNYIYDKDSEIIMTFVRRMLYLFHPLVCISWLPYVPKAKRINFIFILGSLTLGIILVLTIPKFFDKLIIGDYLKELTAFGASRIISIFSGSSVGHTGNTFFGDNYSVIVGTGCASVPNMFLGIFSVLVCYIVCRIMSLGKILFIAFSAVIIAFLFNVLRITVLGYLVSLDKMNLFDFWHEGLGSLSFSLVSMTVTCLIYYIFWAKENPIVKPNS